MVELSIQSPNQGEYGKQIFFLTKPLSPTDFVRSSGFSKNLISHVPNKLNFLRVGWDQDCVSGRGHHESGDFAVNRIQSEALVNF